MAKARGQGSPIGQVDTPAPAVTYWWHDAAWRALTGDPTRLPHALLLHGPAGLGKQAFARRLAYALLCEQPDMLRAPCGRCRGCTLTIAGNHPDLVWIAPSEERKSIVIDQIRTLGEFLALTPHSAQRKVAVLTPADGMQAHAANSLLKILEEPPPGNILILVATQPNRLPATVRSRCRRVAFETPQMERTRDWLCEQGGQGKEDVERMLRLAGGAPLRAQALIEAGFTKNRLSLLQDLDGLLSGRLEPVAVGARWKAHGTLICLEWLSGFVADLIRLRHGSEVAEASNPEAQNFLNTKINMLSSIRLFEYIDVIHDRIGAFQSGSLDENLLLEDILIRWCYMSQGTQPKQKNMIRT